MERSRISIARLMIVTAILALDFWVLRITYRRSELPYDPGALTLVPCLEVAALLAFPRGGRPRHEASPRERGRRA